MDITKVKADRLGVISRGIALFFGGFSLLNVLGEVRYPGFDANQWWIDFYTISPLISGSLLTAAAMFWILYAVRPKWSARRRKYSLTLTAALAGICAVNILVYYSLLLRGGIESKAVIPFSAFVLGGLLVTFKRMLSEKEHRQGLRALVRVAAVTVICMFVFPIAQMYCFGKTDYTRRADAIVVFGARVYADGRLSDALADRVRTGCKLYSDGYSGKIIFSGGKGDGDIHEAEAMRRAAMEMGVPADAIILDKDGVNTQATIDNTCPLFERMGIKRVLAVSHFYHLPRIKMTYARRGREVFTVPAKESYTLSEMPKYMLREIAALWVYYIRPVLD